MGVGSVTIVGRMCLLGNRLIHAYDCWLQALADRLMDLELHDSTYLCAGTYQHGGTFTKDIHHHYLVD